MNDSERPYKDFWAKIIYPFISTDFDRLLKATPKRIAARAEDATKAEKGKKGHDNKPGEEHKKEKKKDTCPVQEKLARTLEEVKKNKERRNVYLNAAWTGPIDNTEFEDQVTLGKVENVAADMFLGNVATDGAAETATEGQDPADAVDATVQRQPKRRAVEECVSADGKRTWKIPESVEKGFEIPIMITNAAQNVVPQLGKFKRLGGDVVVNAIWLAYYWAKMEGNRAALAALENLILDWPFDFVHIAGNTTEEIDENKFKWGVNAAARHERLREFCGLQNSNMLRIVAKATEIVRGLSQAGAKPTAKRVQEWMASNINWGLMNCPDVKAVDRHMANWTSLQKSPVAMRLIEASVTRWGRNNTLDYPTKLQIIATKTDANTMGYVVEALYTRMWRKNMKDPYNAQAIGDAVNEILWVRAYVSNFLRQYPDLFKPTTACDSSQTTSMSQSAESRAMTTARSMLDSPMKFFLQTEGPEKDPTWLQALPSGALRMAMKHFLDVAQELYKQEISGALSQPKAERYNIEKFHKGQRVSKRFFERFQIAYDSLVGTPRTATSQEGGAGTADTTAGTADSAQGVAHEASSEEKVKKSDVSPGDVSAFRAQCEQMCAKELEGRVVMIEAEGTHVEINATLVKTRLYHNLTDQAPVMGFYDVKNARLCNVFEGQLLTHREPALDEEDFERYLKSLDPLMVAGRDVLWVLTGRTKANLKKILTILGKANFNAVEYHLCYNVKQMQQYGHFRRQRGLSNSRSHEILLLCFKGKRPKTLPKVRQYVDQGSSLFQEVVRNVPVLPQKSHALVSKAVREESLQSMVGKDVAEVEQADREKECLPSVANDDDFGEGVGDAGEAAPEDKQPEKTLVNAAVKKRRLYRQLTGTEVPWFPHDNAPEMLQELHHEAGRPRWVYFGTPAGGAGIHGCIESGCSVLALTFDKHHMTHLHPFLVERAVEAMLGSNTMVFQNEALLARSVQLMLTKDTSKDGDKDDKKDGKKDEKKDDKKDDKKKTKKTADKKKKKKTKKKADDDSSSSSDSDSSSEEDPEPKKKKAKTEKA